MSEEILQVLKFFSIGSVVFVLGSFLSALVYPLFRGTIKGCHPATRSLFVIGYGLVSPAVALTVVALVMHPDFSHLLVPSHCHSGACESHVPVIETSSLGGLSLVAGCSLLLVGILFAGLHGVRTAQRRLRVLFGIARLNEQRDYLIVESPDLFAWCCGLWRTKILVSRALVQRLSSRQLQLVLAHERAHERRVDNLRVLALRCLTVFWPARLRNRIRGELASDIERACDLSAAGSFEDRESYVEVLKMLVPGRTATATTIKGTAFGCREAGDRIDDLVNSSIQYRVIYYGAATVFALWLAQIMVMTGLIHYLFEWISSIGA